MTLIELMRLADGYARAYHDDKMQYRYGHAKERAALQSAIEALQAENERSKSAIKTLEHLGYTNKGGELWRPPMGKTPDFNLIDSLRAERDALAAKLVTLEADAERYRWLREDSVPSVSVHMDTNVRNIKLAWVDQIDQLCDAAIDAAKGGKHEDA